MAAKQRQQAVHYVHPCSKHVAACGRIMAAMRADYRAATRPMPSGREAVRAVESSDWASVSCPACLRVRATLLAGANT